ncbi:MAG: thermonuclease family protein [Burkholderiales bacterium]
MPAQCSRRRPRAAWRAALAAAFLALSAPSLADFSGKVVDVADGDTLTVLAGTRSVRIRLWGIDAPEHGQPWSRRARAALRDRALGRVADVAERGVDRYGRTLARVSVEGGDLAEAQVREGHAWVYRFYTDDERLLDLERDARSAGRGLWASGKPEPPWRYRDRIPSGSEYGSSAGRGAVDAPR